MIEQILIDAASRAASNGSTSMITVLMAIIANYLRGIRNDANKALRILQGEGDDGLIGRVDDNEQRSEHNEQRLDRAGIYTDGGDQDAA